MGSKCGDLLMGSLVFNEDTTQELLDDIADLELKRDELFDITSLPETVDELNEEILRLSLTKDELLRDIEEIRYRKTEDIRIDITQEIRNLKKRQSAYKSAEEKLKSDIKKTNDDLKALTDRSSSQKNLFKSEMTALQERQDKVKADIVELDNILNDKKAQNSQIEADIADRNNAIAVKVAEFAETSNIHKEEVSGFNKEKVRFEQEKIEFRSEVDGNRQHFIAEQERLEGLVKETKDKSLVADNKVNEANQMKESLESERLELRAWDKRLNIREERLTKREEDLNTNWTVFENEKGKIDG